MSTITTPTTHKPGDEHRNQRRGNTGRELRTVGLRIQRARLLLRKIERIQGKLGNNKPAILERIEHTLAKCNQELERVCENTAKFADRPDGSRGRLDTFERGGDS